MSDFAIELRGIRKSFGKNEVLSGIDLTVRPGEVTVILGPSGSGKSTLLRTINHLEQVDGGTVRVGGELVGYRRKGDKLYELHEREILRQRARIGFVFQNFNLFPHLTVRENVALAPVAAQRRAKGHSIFSGQTVTGALADALPSTLALAVSGLLPAVIGGTGLALAAAYTSRPWLRGLLTALPPIGASMPAFWVGLLLLQLFSFRLRLVPAFGGTGFAGTVLPAVTLALPVGAVIAQVLHTSLVATWRQPFVEVAFAKGASRWWVQLRHVLRPAATPALTVAGLWVGQVLAGSVVTETVFSRPGLGRLTQESVLHQDIPVVQGIVVFAALVFVTVNLLIDLSYPLLDPLVAQRYSRKESAHV